MHSSNMGALHIGEIILHSFFTKSDATRNQPSSGHGIVNRLMPIMDFVDPEHIIFHEKSPRESLLSRVKRLTT